MAIALTAVIHRKENEIRMLSYSHIVLMCMAASLACFGLALFWQADSQQSQCDTYLWVISLPLSFVVHLNNMKAYRLSVYMKSEGKRMKYPFTHSKVLRMTLMYLLVTIIVLLVIAYADPPVSTKIIEDPLRPIYDHYTCKNGSVANGLLYFLFAFHIAVSFNSVIAVRNGSEAYYDGTVIKEAFILFYVCIILAWILAQLGVNYEKDYVVRTAFVAGGTMALCFRLLFTRCLKHWVPETVREAFHAKVYLPFKAAFEVIVPPDSYASSSTNSSGLLDDDEKPAFDAPDPIDDDLENMLEVFDDPSRLAVFKDIANKLHITENILFIQAVIDFKLKAANSLVEQSSGDAIKAMADELHKKFVVAGCDDEVNVSDKAKKEIAEALKVKILHYCI